MFNWFCHQIAERSLSVDWFVMIVCARCAGIYVGALLGLVIWGFSRKTESPFVGLLCACVGMFPLLVDGVLQLSGVWESVNWLRFLTGLFCGSLLMFGLLIAVPIKMKTGLSVKFAICSLVGAIIPVWSIMFVNSVFILRCLNLLSILGFISLHFVFVGVLGTYFVLGVIEWIHRIRS